jgi:hypothetical protein
MMCPLEISMGKVGGERKISIVGRRSILYRQNRHPEETERPQSGPLFPQDVADCTKMRSPPKGQTAYLAQCLP